MRHHFLFWFQAANLEYLGPTDPTWSINLISVLTMVAMLVRILVLGEVLFDSRIVSRIAWVLFFFSGSFAYIPFCAQEIAWRDRSVFGLKRFLRSEFPYLEENWKL